MSSQLCIFVSAGFLGSAKEIGNYNVIPVVEEPQDREEINEEEFEVAATVSSTILQNVWFMYININLIRDSKEFDL